jgi:hypothetical protein
VSRTHRSRVAALVAVATLALGALTSCAADAGSGESGDLTLTSLKSPIQLLRNEAAARIPSDVVDSIVQPTDNSSACKPLAEDPDGKYRTWESSVLTLIKLDSAEKVAAIEQALIDSFTAEGWVEGTGTGTKTTRLSRDTTFATIDISFVEHDIPSKVVGQIQVTTLGPCVLTDGPDSPEVRKLEGKG